MNNIAKLLTVGLLSLPLTAISAFSSSGWVMVPRSDQNDFKIICKEGNNIVWGIYPRGDTSEYQVARNIYMLRTDDGRFVLSFMRGFISANKETTYIPAQGVSCEASEK